MLLLLLLLLGMCYVVGAVAVAVVAPRSHAADATRVISSRKVQVILA